MTQTTVVIERELNAPLNLVFRAFADQKMAQKWMAPDGFTCPELVFEPKQGGQMLTVFDDQTGVRSYAKGTITDFEQDTYIAYDFGVEYGEFQMKDMRTEISFTAHGEKTLVTVSLTAPSEDFAEGCKIGWNQSFDNLEELIKKEVN
ncbi:MAG: SRPBCC domain-containing protein [Fimbriimonadaceae bacterium]|nr:SRPBCC domain-containing protein [Fimbriimonadaceae bacterium]